MTNYNKLTNKEFDELMCSKYPLLYVDRHASMQETCMMWGFCIGPGWHNLVADASEKIEVILRAMPEDQRVMFRASQLKEKFAQLRLYMTAYYKPISDIIHQAENLSAITCDTCGEPGSIKGTGWIYTMCDMCWKNRNDKRGV